MSRSCLAMTPPAYRALIRSNCTLALAKLSFVALQVGLRGGQRHLIGPRIDLDEQFALLNVLTFLEVDLRDLPVNPGLQRDSVESLH